MDERWNAPAVAASAEAPDFASTSQRARVLVDVLGLDLPSAFEVLAIGRGNPGCIID